MNRRRLRPLTFAVVVVLLAITATLTWAAHTVNAHSNQRLLEQQLDQAAVAVSGSLPIVQSQLAQAVQLATATRADPQIFRRFVTPLIQGALTSVSLWKIDDGHADMIAIAGDTPALVSEHLDASFFAGVHPSSTLFVTDIIPGATPHVGYAEMPEAGTSGLAAYAEVAIAPARPIPPDPSSPFANLDLAVYLGMQTTDSHLIASTRATPLPGRTATTSVPFGDTVVTLVGSSRTQLAGDLSAALPWIALGIGLGLTLMLGITVEYMGRRRGVAEALAADNARLYREQHGIASTLQHALLPDVPDDPSIDVAARYVAGVAGVDVGGDWYDVMRTGPHSLTFFVGDVSGRGLRAAATMASLRFAARAYVTDGDDIATALTKLGRLIDIETDQQFATVLAGEIDVAACRLRIASAGHYLPLLITKESTEFLACEVQPPLGVAPQQHVTMLEIDLPPAGSLLAFTDGLVERRGESIDVGQRRLRDAASGLDVPLPDVLDALLAALVPDGADDDVAMLAIRWA